MATTKRTAAARRRTRVTNAVPDAPDFRDRLYVAPVHSRPPAQFMPPKAIPVLNQGDTSGCTGFALASVVHWLTKEDGRPAEQVSPFMLYSMARRYDEFSGTTDTGSSLRGALKGWHKHGACALVLWPALDMPKVPADPKKDWWCDAPRRPLGAYYRIEPQMIPDMHVALAEVGIIYASAVCHSGWDEGDRTKGKAPAYWDIPRRPARAADGAHAFAIVGYDENGFIIQNSWGERWGSRGLARLSYEDWRENAMDCWVVQMGVVTALHLAVAAAPTLRLTKGKVELASDTTLRNHELAPFIVDMENDGVLSTSGSFRTSAGDVKALVTTYLERARGDWGLAPNDPVDIAVYAHGGLVSESGAADAAGRWIPALYENRIFPVFLMWETDLFKTLENIAKELILGEPRRAAGIERWWNERIEKLLAPLGTQIWGEIKENAELITGSAQGGGMVLYRAAMQSPAFKPRRDRIHLVGHSAGSVVHAHLVDALAPRGWKFRTVNFMAPAARLDLFTAKLLPHVRSGKVAQYNQWHLSDALERADPTCRPILGYGRSLLYLVSQACEGGVPTPLVGMERSFDEIRRLGLANVKAYTAQCADTAASTHGAFDDDEVTMRSVIRRIRAARD
jgi:hypothetical protein